MIKKISILLISLIIICLCLTGCGKEESAKSSQSSSTPIKTEITIKDVLAEFEKQGISVKLESKPYYALIEANDGEMFYLDN